MKISTVHGAVVSLMHITVPEFLSHYVPSFEQSDYFKANPALLPLASLEELWSVKHIKMITKMSSNSPIELPVSLFYFKTSGELDDNFTEALALSGMPLPMKTYLGGIFHRIVDGEHLVHSQPFYVKEELFDKANSGALPMSFVDDVATLLSQSMVFPAGDPGKKLFTDGDTFEGEK